MKTCFKKLKDKLVIKSNWLILTLTLYFGFVLNLSFWRFVVQNIQVTNCSVVWFIVSLIFFILFPLFLLFNIIVIPKAAKPLIILFLMISSATNYLMFTLGVFIDSDMIRNVFETNAREAADLITFSGFMWVLITGVVPSVVVGFSTIVYKPFLKELAKRVILIACGLVLLGIFAATTYKEYASFGRNNREVRKIINTVNYTYSTIRYMQKKIKANRVFKRLDENAVLTPYEDAAKTVLILVLGETARAKNFSIYGYERDTNPLLAKEDIISFDEVASCGTATAVSVPCMFSHMTRTNFDVDDAKFTENMLDILQTGGYDVIWLENDDGCKGVCSRVKTEDMVKINNPKYCNGKYCYDGVLLDGLEERLTDLQNDTIIVLHTMGSHGPTYYNRYPDEFKKFTPTCDTADIQNCSRDEIINTYDNTILYTDYIVASAINVLKKFPDYESGLIYISDHGESLGENNVYLHGFPYKLAPKEQKHVPLILWMSENMKKFDHVDYECMHREADTKTFTHDNLFHSIIGLLEVKTTAYQKPYDVFEPCRTKELPF